MFFQAFSNINYAFHSHKDRKDNRWKHGPLFYNPSLTREVWQGKKPQKLKPPLAPKGNKKVPLVPKGNKKVPLAPKGKKTKKIPLAPKGKKPKKPFKSNQVSLVPKYFGLPHAICSEIKIDQMFENNKIIPQDLFVTKFKQEINFLDYDRLCKSIKLNIITVDGPINMNKEEEPPHFKSYFHEYFGTTTKGSQLFRRILKYDNPDTPIYNIEVWRKKLNTDEICQGEVRNAYKLLQNKYLPRQLLDFKARIVMGKTQFNYTLSKWTKENISQDNFWTLKPE